MTAVCPLCDHEYENNVHLKSGSWALEPIENLLRGVDVTEADGGLCASWGGDHLDHYIHTNSQFEGGPVR